MLAKGAACGIPPAFREEAVLSETRRLPPSSCECVEVPAGSGSWGGAGDGGVLGTGISGRATAGAGLAAELEAELKWNSTWKQGWKQQFEAELQLEPGKRKPVLQK